MDFSNVILFSDMDGTLLDSKGKVSEENCQAVKDFIAQGGLFGIATGRSQWNSILFLEGIEVNVPCILYNGCGIYDFKAEKFIALYELNKTKLIDFLQYCINEFQDLAIQIYCPEQCYVISPEERADADFIEIHKPVEFKRLEDLKDKAWIKILFYGKTTELEALQGVIKDFHLENDISSVYSAEVYLELLPYHVSKGSALTKLREYMGGNYQIYAVGDYNNDVEMLQAADVGIATFNALPRVKEIAEVITVSNDDSVVADIIHRIIPERHIRSSFHD